VNGTRCAVPPNKEDAGPTTQDGYPAVRLGLIAAVVVCVLDQATKLWLLYGYGLADRGPVALAPMLDLVLVRNYGISYGWFQGIGVSARWILVAIAAGAVVFLWAWLSHTQSRLAGLALGLIIGGAVGNAIDRIAQDGAVVDFLRFRLAFFPYVFNISDSAIVAGVIGLLYDSLLGSRAAKLP
jgi:signal peptidase II